MSITKECIYDKGFALVFLDMLRLWQIGQ